MLRSKWRLRQTIQNRVLLDIHNLWSRYMHSTYILYCSRINLSASEVNHKNTARGKAKGYRRWELWCCGDVEPAEAQNGTVLDLGLFGRKGPHTDRLVVRSRYDMSAVAGEGLKQH